LLSRIVDIRPGEEKLVLLLFACFFLITSPHTIIKALRYSDLLWKLGPGGLPVAYLAAALVTGGVVVFQARLHPRFSGQRLITASLAFFIISGFLLHFLLLTEYGKRSASLSYLYWVWASVLTIVLLTQFWLIVNDVFNPREAKRLIGFCGSGGILGGIVGGLLAGFLTRMNLADLLLPLACGFLFVCAFVVRAIFTVRKKAGAPASRPSSAPEPHEAPRMGFGESFRAVRRTPYLTYLSWMVVITVIVSTFIDFQFGSAVEASFRTKESMQAFFGLFFAGLLTFSFLLNFFLTSSILRRFGIRFTLLLTPSALFVCALGIIFAPFTLLPAIFIKGSDESLAFSLHQAVREILYIPVSPGLKARVKPFIDMFINRFAKVIAAVLLLAFALLLNKEVEYLTPVFDPELAKELVWGVLAFLALWALLAAKMGKEYLSAIRKSIKVRWGRADQELEKKLDVDHARLVFDTIESRSRSSVLYALHLFDLLERDKLTPEIKKILAQKSDEVTASSLGDMFNAEGATFFPEIEEEGEQEGFITDIREIMSLDAYQQVMKLHADEVMKKSKQSEIERMELAKAIGLMAPDSPVVEKLEGLIRDDSPEVACYAIRSAARHKRPEHIPALIRRLADPQTYEDAVSALKAYGRAAIRPLQACIADSKREVRIRRAAVRVLAGIGSEEALGVLLEELDQGGKELQSEIIDALDRIRSENPDIPVPSRLAKRVILSAVKEYGRAFIKLQELEPGEKTEEKKRRLERALEVLLRDIFKLLGLYHPREDMVKAYQNIQAGTKHAMAYAAELLDNCLKKDMKDAVLSLVEEMPPSERVRKLRKLLKSL